MEIAIIAVVVGLSWADSSGSWRPATVETPRARITLRTHRMLRRRPARMEPVPPGMPARAPSP